MTLQDLKNNRQRIINNIPMRDALKEVMEMMAKRVNYEKDTKPTLQNIDKLTNEIYHWWLQNRYEPTKEQMEATMEKSRINQAKSAGLLD